MYLLKYLFFSKWTFKLPKKNKFLLVDGIYNPFLKYLKKKDFTYLFRRGEEINFAIILRCVLSFKFSSIAYFAEYIKCVSPKLILTAFDYHTIFYKLSKKTGVKTLMIQKGKRSEGDSLIRKKNFFFPKNSKKNYHIDYVLVFNEAVKSFYEKRISGNFFSIGSFENNFTKLNLKKIKKEIIFVSNFNILSNNTISPKSENEDKIAYNLYALAKKNKIKFNILPRYRKNPDYLKKEISFYNNVNLKNINFILNKKLSSYEIINNYKFIFASYSTLAIESLSKGARTGFIFCKSKNNPAFHLWLGSFEKLKKNGLFWTTSYNIDKKIIKKIFNFVIYNKDYKNKTKPFIKKIMNYDYGNKTFKKILKNNQINFKNN